MDLEQLKSALDGRKFEGYLFDRPVRQITLDVQRIARQMASNYRAKDLQGIFTALAATLLWCFWFEKGQPWWANLGVALVIVASLLGGVCALKLYRQGRNTRLDVSRRIYLTAERERLVTRLRMLNRCTIIAGAPLLAGILLQIAVYTKSPLEYATIVTLTLLLCIAAAWSADRKYKKGLRQLVKELDSQLAEIDADSE